MRILVTGGAGYIGAHTLVDLLSGGHDAVVLDNFDNGSRAALDRVAEITGRAPAVERVDLRRRDDTEAALERHRPDAVLHFAGLKAVGRSVAEPLSYYDTNVAGTLSLLSAMERCGCRKIIFSSTATVYGPPVYLPYDESHPLSPQSPYAASKAMVERILSDWTACGDGRRSISLRYFNPVGAHPSGRIGEDPRGVPDNLLPFLAQVATGRREALRIWGDDYDTPDGTGVRDYIHIVDLTRAHTAALERIHGPGAAAEIYNIGTGRGYSVRQILSAFERVVGRSLPAEVHPRRDGDIARMEAACERANRVLGWRAEHGIDEIVETLWNWQTANPSGYGRREGAERDGRP